MAERIRFEVADSRAFLPRLASEVDHVDFAFLDGDRRWPAVSTLRWRWTRWSARKSPPLA